MTLQVSLTANELIVVMYGGDCRACVWFCVVYGRKPSKNQKDHREQLLANHKPVETMAGRRMVRHLPAPNTMGIGCVTRRAQVGMLKMIRNLAFAHRSQHVQQGRFNTEDEVPGAIGIARSVSSW